MKCFLGSWKFEFFEEFGDLLLLLGNSLGCYCSSKEIYFLSTKMAFGHAELKASFPQALENYSYVFDQLLRVIGGYTNILDILCTLIGFDDWIEVFAYEVRRFQ